jgi:hypothetical protein
VDSYFLRELEVKNAACVSEGGAAPLFLTPPPSFFTGRRIKGDGFIGRKEPAPYCDTGVMLYRTPNRVENDTGNGDSITAFCYT